MVGAEWVVAVSSTVVATAVVALAREIRDDLRGFVQTVEANRWRSRVAWESLRRREMIEDSDRVPVGEVPEAVRVRPEKDDNEADT